MVPREESRGGRPRNDRRFTDRRDGDGGKPSVFRRSRNDLGYVVQAMQDLPGDGRARKTVVSPAEQKLADIIAFARLATEAAKKTAALLVSSPATRQLDEFCEQTERIKGRSIQVADSLEHREEIRELGYEAYEEGTATLNGFLHPGFSAIEGLDYLAMAQAETIGHWAMLQNMDPPPELTELADWALPQLRDQLRKVAMAAASFDRRKSQPVNLD